MSADDQFEQHLRTMSALGLQRGPVPDHDLYERFMGEFHQAFPNATGDEYVRFKHVAAVAAGVLITYHEND